MKKLGIFMILFVFSFSINIVKAETITLEQVASKVEEILIETITEGQDFDVITTENSLTLTIDDDFKMVFNFNNDVLTIKYPIDFDSSRYAGGCAVITQAVNELHGYSDKDWEYFGKIEDATLDSDGYEIVMLSSSELKFSIDINDFKLNLEYIKTEKPIVSLLVEDNNISISATVNANDGTSVDFYGSEDGKDFKYLFSRFVYSGKTATISISDMHQDNLKYYKAVVAKSNNFSDVVSTKTLNEDKEENNNSNNNENQNNQESSIDNPKTETNSIVSLIIVGVIVVIGVIGGISLYISIKKNKMHKI